MKKIRNRIDGVLLLDKPLGLSSNQAIQKVKHLLNAEKVGHTGTLDPLASGLLPVCLGEATKFAGYLLDSNKEYLATVQLGLVTTTGDSEGRIVSSRPVTCSGVDIVQVCESFCGQIAQTPPLYSAIKYQGKPLYEYARAGIDVPRASRAVSIYELEVLSYDGLTHSFQLRTRVSKGTYIRTLAVDIGEKLGCGASLSALRRTQTNQFNLTQAVSLTQLKELQEQGRELPLLACGVLAQDLPVYQLNPVQFAIIRFGNILNLDEPLAGVAEGGEVRLFAADLFLGVAIYANLASQLSLRPKRLISGLAQLQPWR